MVFKATIVIFDHENLYKDTNFITFWREIAILWRFQIFGVMAAQECLRFRRRGAKWMQIIVEMSYCCILMLNQPIWIRFHAAGKEFFHHDGPVAGRRPYCFCFVQGQTGHRKACTNLFCVLVDPKLLTCQFSESCPQTPGLKNSCQAILLPV